MASTFEVSAIAADVANLSNSPAFGANTRITSTQATSWIAQSARSLSALIRQKFPEDRDFLQVADIPTIPSFPLISLPPDTGEVHAVLWIKSATEAVLLESAGAQDTQLMPLETGVGWEGDNAIRTDITTYTPRWRIEGQTLSFYPASGLAEQIQVFYTTHMSPSSGTFQGRLDFDRWVTLDVCIKVATAKKKYDQVQDFQRQKALLENDLLALARKRDIAPRHTIRDLRAEAMGRDYRRRWGL